MRVVVGALALVLGLSTSALAADEVSFGTNWKAQAEHGGFYQALATGIYAKYGLEVTIRQGGPQVNHSQLLAAGRIDFNMGGNLFNSLNYPAQKIPVVTVAAMFQKDPQVLISHPGVGNDSLAALKGKTIFVSGDGRASFWLWLKQKYGYADEQIKPYTFNPAPFLADKSSTQQGYATSEPFSIEKAGVKPVVHLLADNGFETYSTLIETTSKMVAEKPDLVQRFVDASILGWQSYISGDPAAANALIKKDNPEMTDELIAYSIKTMKEMGIVDSGESKVNGIGAMDEARWKRFAEFAISVGVYPKDLDWKAAFTTQFVNKKVGLAK